MSKSTKAANFIDGARHETYTQVMHAIHNSNYLAPPAERKIAF